MAEPLLDPELIAALEQLQLMSRKIFTGRMRGERRTRKRGVSIEFADYRNYAQGDDLRFIDWNIYGRLDRLLLKLFHEEEDLCVYLLVDRSFSMAYGSPTKLDYAKKVAAALGFIALHNQERVVVTAFSEDMDLMFRPARGRRQMWKMFDFLEALRPDGSTGLYKALRSFSIRNRRAGILVILSDFLDPDGYEKALRLAVGLRMEIFCIHVLAAEELEPELAGDLKLVDVETADEAEITISAPLLASYRKRLDAFRKGLQAFCSQRGATYLFTSTDTPVSELILTALRLRGLVK